MGSCWRANKKFGGLEMSKVIELARTLGTALQNDEALARLNAANKANDEDKELGAMIDKFNNMRAELNEAIMNTSEDKDQEAIAKLDAEFKALYSEIMNRPTMVEFSEAKNEADKLLNFVLKIINGSVNGENPNEIVEDSEDEGCSGSCSSCKGCH